MRLTPRRIGEVLRISQRPIESLDLFLGTRILPIRTERVTKRALPLAFSTAFELLQQCLPRVQISEKVLSILAPKHSTVLHARTTDTLDLREICTLLFQPLQDKINRFQKQSNRREHLALGGVRQHALFDAIFRAEVGVKVDFGFVEELEVRADDDSYVC